MVIDAIEDSEAEAAEIFGGAAAESAVMVGVSKALLAELEDEWEGGLEDFGVVGAVGVGGRSGRKRAQRVFRALAEVSHAAGSRMLGSVLRTFFLGWLYELAEEEDAVVLAGWCWGVAKAWMNSEGEGGEFEGSGGVEAGCSGRFEREGGGGGRGVVAFAFVFGRWWVFFGGGGGLAPAQEGGGEEVVGR